MWLWRRRGHMIKVYEIMHNIDRIEDSKLFENVTYDRLRFILYT